jgi:outer membrane PBP1 activator LpoA protein
LTLLAAALFSSAVQAQISTAHASRRDDIEAAASLARGGEHAQAARLYETAAKRFFGWDAHVAVLSAREYALAGLLTDAERMLDKPRRVRGDDVVLAASVRAQIALERNDPRKALATLERLAEPLPAALAPEVLLLEARAAFAAGEPLAGVRAYDARARALATTAEREANYRALIEALQAALAEAVPADASDAERGWFELSALLQAAPAGVPSPEQSADWRARHPDHAGEFLLPAAPLIARPPTTTPSPPGVAPSATFAGRPSLMALLLPLSGRHRASGIAIRDGFMAAWLADPADLRPELRVYDTATDPAGTYARAITSGARFVVGPLLKEDLAAVSAQQIPVPTLALNALSGGQAPSFLYQFSLDPADEARAAARRIVHDGHTRGVALFPANAWGQRLSEAFATELAAANVTLIATQLYDPKAHDFSGPLRAVLGRFGGAGDRDADNKLVSANRDAVAEARDGPQFAFIAANTTTARALKPQLRFQMVYDLPIYSTSDAWDPSVRSDTDMDGLLFPEMPWLLSGGMGAIELWNALQTQWKTEARGRWRLYAFGFDAYRLANSLGASSSGYVALNGLTGALQVHEDGVVHRELDWAQIAGGREVAAGNGPPLPVPSEPRDHDRARAARGSAGGRAPRSQRAPAAGTQFPLSRRRDRSRHARRRDARARRGPLARERCLRRRGGVGRWPQAAPSDPRRTQAAAGAARLSRAVGALRRRRVRCGRV